MKKTITTAILLAAFSIAFGQSKPKPNDFVTKATYPKEQTPLITDAKKKKYTYFVKLSVQDFQSITGALSEYKALQMYAPNTTDAQKVAIFKQVGEYLEALPKRVKLDSSEVK